MAVYDVIILGLGAMGSAAAYHLARRGLRVLGLEQFTPAHDRGASHGRSRIIREAYFEDPAYVPLIQRAYALWGDLQAQTGTPLLVTTGGLMIGPREGALVSGGAASPARPRLGHGRLGPAGPWAGQILADLGLPLEVERNVMYWFHPLRNADAFGPERFPVYILEYTPGAFVYGFPALGDEGIKIAHHHSGERCTPASI